MISKTPNDSHYGTISAIDPVNILDYNIVLLILKSNYE